jgi:hypothetical protein
LVQIFSSVSSSQTLSIYAPPSAWDTKSHTHTKQQLKL